MSVDPNKEKMDASTAIEKMQPMYGLTKDRYAKVYDGQEVDGATIEVTNRVVTGITGGGGGGGTTFGMPVTSVTDGFTLNSEGVGLYGVMQYYTDIYGTVGFQIIDINETTVSFDPEGPLTLGDPIPDDPYGQIMLDNNLTTLNEDVETAVEITVTFTFEATDEVIVQKRRITVVPQ